MRERIASDGIRSLHDHEVLEYLLFPFVPRRNTNEIAHRLMEKFGTFSEVFNADAADLAAVPGMTENAALFFSVLPEVLRRYAVSVAKKRPQLSGRRAVRDFLAGVMFGMPVEAVCAAALDAQDGLIRFDILAKGTGDGVGVTPRDAVVFALQSKAVSVVLAHNHPSGKAEPSQRDDESLESIGKVCRMHGVFLRDSVIVSGEDLYSYYLHDRMGQFR